MGCVRKQNRENKNIKISVKKMKIFANKQKLNIFFISILVSKTGWMFCLEEKSKELPWLVCFTTDLNSLFWMNVKKRKTTRTQNKPKTNKYNVKISKIRYFRCFNWCWAFNLHSLQISRNHFVHNFTQKNCKKTNNQTSSLFSYFFFLCQNLVMEISRNGFGI